MGVDKFGRHIVSSGKGERGPKGEGFTFTNDGSFDVQGKRLCNVSSAKEESDATNLADLKSMISPCIREVNGVFNFHNKAVTGIDDPKNEQDAVNLRVLKRKSLNETTDGHYDVKNKKICNMLSALNDSDAVNLGDVKSLIRPCVKEVNGVFNFKNKTVTGIEDPKNDLDAVNYKVLKRNIIPLTSQGYNAKGRKITNVKGPETSSDVVCLKYLNDNCIVKDPKTGIYNANNKTISHVSDPKGGQDAVTYNALMAIISKFGWVIYNNLHKDKKIHLNFADWYNIVKLDPYSVKTWDDAFTLTEVKDNKIVKDGATGKAS